MRSMIFGTQESVEKIRTGGGSLRQRAAVLAATAGFAAGLMLTPAAFAQADHMEWEPGEGVHEEEWYDPTDWFDDDFDGFSGTDTDYEYGDGLTEEWRDDDDDDDDDSVAFYDDVMYESGWWVDATTTLYGDGYYDGYMDGYDDDEYGYDVDIIGSYLSTNYKSGYIDGYYDAFYDNERGYDADWTYYLYTVPVDKDRQQAQKERRDDDNRSRGDRSEQAGTDSMRSADARKDAKQKELSRFRGEVAGVERMRWQKAPDRVDGHTLLRVDMEDGRSLVVDLGEDGPRRAFAEGDRITIHGRRMSIEGKKIVDADRLSVNGSQLWNSSGKKKPARMSSKD